MFTETSQSDHTNSRILIIDDASSIHDDFRKILLSTRTNSNTLCQLERDIFGDRPLPGEPRPSDSYFEIDSAYQGEEGWKMVKRSIIEKNPYAMAFVDMSMPPGWDGLETVKHLWQEDSHLQIVICTAHSENSWSDMRDCFTRTDQWLLLKKPFDHVEILQLAHSLVSKWNLKTRADRQMEALETAKREAEKAGRAKLEFLTNMSHELRTPMHGILSFANLGIRKIHQSDKHKLLDYFTEIHSSGSRLLVLLNDLLDLSKLESGKMNYTFQKHNITPLITISINEFTALAKEKEIVIDFSKPDVENSVTIDANRMIQVIKNLLSNAIKFSKPKSKIEIRVTESADRIVLAIADYGVGIPEKEISSVFDKFTQSGKNRSDIGGTGLGLPICKQIINDHNGQIWAENNPDGGTIFFVSLGK